jgi:hypothetical protein
MNTFLDSETLGEREGEEGGDPVQKFRAQI